MTCTWLADASSVAFLDLGVSEFHLKRKTTLISALDLCAQPRNYYCISYHQCIIAFDNGEGIGIYASNLPTVPNVPLFEVFKSIQTITDEEFDNFDDVAVNFFNDFGGYLLKSLATKGNPEIVKLYLKHLRAYCHYIENSLFCASLNECGLISEMVLTYYDDENSEIIRNILAEILPKVTDLMFDNKFPDSSLVWELFYTVRNYKLIQMNILFNCKPAIMEYILHHLRKCNIKDIWPIRSENWQFKYGFQCLIRGKPEHLLIQLKYGVRIIYEPIIVAYELFIGRHGHQRLLRIRKHFEDVWFFLNLRERTLAEIIICYLLWTPKRFATYLESLRIIWRASTEPYLTYEELEDVLMIYVDSSDADDLHDEFHKHEIDFFTDDSQPRRLTHYCRCVIRDALICNSQLPEGIELLNLPTRLQSYISLEF